MEIRYTMIKKYFVFIVSFIFGLLFWVIDAAFDFFVYYEKSFLELLISDIPGFEIYMRSIVLGLFFIFGIILSKVMNKRISAEEKNQKQRPEPKGKQKR